MNGSHTQRPSSPRTLFSLFTLAAIGVALLAAAAPALGYGAWKHNTAMGKASCNDSGCHRNRAPSNAACINCHSGLTTSGSRKCWDCHAPGTAPSVSCVDSCHLYQVSGDDPAYPIAFTHGSAPHLGASGYGKTCVDCHGAGNAHHDATAGHQPTCAECHNGSIAAAPTAHASYGADCATCHTGMNRPSGDCLTCHDRAQGGVPAVVYTNDLSCSDAACHGKIKNHMGTSIRAAACTSCHAAHYESLGVCTTCHADPQGFHHGTATATPLAACSACHEGKIAAAKQGHAGYACASCHAGMARPPVPATCQDCHAAQTFGAVACTECHSTTGMIGKETVHTTDPAATVSCTTCHQTHYEDLGACDTCHGSHAQTHHGTATLVDTRLRLAVAPAVIKAHTKATLKGRLSAVGEVLASRSVLIQARSLKGGSFKKVAVVKTGRDGRFSRVVKPRVGTEYRAVWRPSGASVARQRPAVVTVTLRVRR